MDVSYVYNFSVYGHMELHADFNHAPVCRKIGCRHGRFICLYLLYMLIIWTLSPYGAPITEGGFLARVVTRGYYYSTPSGLVSLDVCSIIMLLCVYFY